MCIILRVNVYIERKRERETSLSNMVSCLKFSTLALHFPYTCLYVKAAINVDSELCAFYALFTDLFLQPCLGKQGDFEPNTSGV